MKRHRAFIVSLSLTSMVAGAGAVGYGCSDDKDRPSSFDDDDAGKGSRDAKASGGGDATSGSALTAVATLEPTSSASQVGGTASFTEEDGKVTAVINVTNGGTAGLHGLHLHQNPACGTTGDGGPASPVTPGGGAGAHWNPADAGHAYPTAPSHHAGDMGNITIKDDGTGTLTITSESWTVKDGPMSVVGHAVIYHAGTDDGVTAGTGDAGARAGCGVITKP
jgi:Cu-Zn family superoxide dismutase